MKKTEARNTSVLDALKTTSLIAAAFVLQAGEARAEQQSAAPDAGAPAGNTQAQVEISEVVVTARRREERLQDVPMAVSAFDGLELEERHIKTVNDLTSLAPGLSVQNTSGNRTEATYSIRGQGQTYGQEG